MKSKYHSTDGRYSILYPLDECYVCHTTNTEIHEVFYGTANRKKSIKYGCCVGLCHEHHLGRDGVHFDKELDMKLKKLYQEKFTSIYGQEKWFKEFHKSYL